jgi:serine/threonine protein kinase, bacterial
MASVFLAEDVELGRRVAIKRLHPDTSEETAPRFRREMRVVASLSHPNVVKLFDAVEDDGAVLLVMEYVDGPSLAERMRDGALDPDDAIAILRALAAAIDHLHEHGIIHRDVKPANVLLDGDDRVKVADLGIASAAHATGITSTGTILGTPAYMAPEAFDGARATSAVDVYSVAAIAYEMLSGERVRAGGTPAAIALRAATDPPPDLRAVRPEAGALADVLARGMARDPSERPATATALVGAIEAALDEAGAPDQASVPDQAGVPDATAPPDETAPATTATEPTPPAPRARRRSRSPVALLVAAAALALAAVAAIVIATTSGGDPDRHASTTRRSTTADARTGTTTSNASGSGAGRAATTAAAASPTAAVEGFYERAAAHRYDDAWALAAPSLRAQLGGFDAFRRQFADVRSIVFQRAATVARSASAATVALTTTATHTDRVDHCTGTAQTAPGADGGWVMTHIAVSC